MFNKAVFFINPIIEFAKINNRSVPGNALKVITRIAWLATDVLSSSAVLVTHLQGTALGEKGMVEQQTTL